MNKIEKAFIISTLGAYMGCFINTARAYPPIANIPVIWQLTYYTVIMVIYLLVIAEALPRSWYVYLSLLYGIAAMSAYSGSVEWVNYAGSQDLHGLAMASWDLALAIVFAKEGLPGA